MEGFVTVVVILLIGLGLLIMPLSLLMKEIYSLVEVTSRCLMMVLLIGFCIFLQFFVFLPSVIIVGVVMMVARRLELFTVTLLIFPLVVFVVRIVCIYFEVFLVCIFRVGLVEVGFGCLLRFSWIVLAVGFVALSVAIFLARSRKGNHGDLFLMAASPKKLV